MVIRKSHLILVKGLYLPLPDIGAAFRQGRLASLISVEGGHSLGSSMGVIRSLYELGVRIITLTHNCHTPW